MKKIFCFAYTLLLLACGGGDDAGGGGSQTGGSEYLNVSNVDIPGGNTTATLNIQASNNCEWVISWSDSWIRSMSPTKGRGSQNVTVTVNVNPSSTAERTAVVIVKNLAGTIERQVIIAQQPNSEQVSFSPSSLSFTADGGSQEVTITSNTHWSITGLSSWIELSKSEGEGNGSINIKVLPNTTSDSREAVLTIKGSGGISGELTIRQTVRETEFYITSSTNLSAGALAENLTIGIAGNADWVVSSNREWATPSITSGQGTQAINVALTDNTSEEQREAAVTIMSTGKDPITVHITQAAGSRPQVSNLQVSNTQKIGCMLSFSFSSIFPVTEYGVCYATAENPTINNSHVSQSGAGKEGTGSFQLININSGTTYYVRAYAINVVGIQYSEPSTFAIDRTWPGGDDNQKPNL